MDKMRSVFVHAQVMESVHAGGSESRVKKWQNFVHIVVECPLVYFFLKIRGHSSSTLQSSVKFCSDLLVLRQSVTWIRLYFCVFLSIWIVYSNSVAIFLIHLNIYLFFSKWFERTCYWVCNQYLIFWKKDPSCFRRCPE